MFALLWAIIVYVAWYIALPIGLAYLGGKLFGQDLKQPDTSARENAQSRSWNPHTTQREGTPRPRAYGRNMHHGNIVAKWTAVSGDDREVLYMIVEHGDGPTKGIGSNQVYLNDQPASNFGTVTIQERLGTMDQTCMEGFEKTKLEYELGNELLYGEAPTIFTTPNDFFDDLEYTVMLPLGLVKYQKDGDRKASAVTLRVRISEHGLDSWTTVFNTNIWGNSLTPLFKLYTLSTLGFTPVHGKQYDLEFARMSPKGERHTNDIYIKSVREVVDVAFTRPGKALTGIKAVATTRLSGSIDVKVIREDRLLNVYNGTSWEIKYSRNRAWVTWDVLTQPIINGNGDGLYASLGKPIPFEIVRYEGSVPARLDLAFFYEWAEWCENQVLDGYGGTEDRMACDTIVDFQTDIWTLANEIANIGRANLYWQGHTLTGWVDKPVTTPIDLVTMDNIMTRTWRNSWVEPATLAGIVEVFFQDSRQGYERMPAPFGNENAGMYTRPVSIEGVGVTTRGTAIHVANHALERNRLIRNVNSFRQYKDAFRYRLGRVIKLQHRVPNWGQSYRVIKSSANNTVQLDRNVEAEVAVGDILFLRVYSETEKKVRIDSYAVQSRVGKVVTITETWLVAPTKGCIVATGMAGAIQTRRIIKMEPTGDNYFEVTVETYDPELFEADELDPDNPDKKYIWPAPAGQLTRPVTRAEVVDLIAQLIPPQTDVDIPSRSNCTWDGDSVSAISWAATTAGEPITFRYRGVSYEITPGDTTDEYIFWDPAYSTMFRTTNLISVAVAAGCWLMCTNEDGVPHPANPIQLLHAGILLAGTIRAAQIISIGWGQVDGAGKPENNADVTADHTAAAIMGQGALATKNNVGLDTDVIDGTTYARMLAAWRMTGDLTKIDGGKIFTHSVTAAQITTGELITLTAQIKNAIIDHAKIGLLEVYTGNIADSATGAKCRAYNSDEISCPYGETTIISASMTTVAGGTVDIDATCNITEWPTSTYSKLRIYVGGSIVKEVTINNGGVYRYVINVASVAGSTSYSMTIVTLQSGASTKAIERSIVADEDRGK